MNITYDLLFEMTEACHREACDLEIANTTGSDYNIGFYTGMHQGINFILDKLNRIDDACPDEVDDIVPYKTLRTIIFKNHTINTYIDGDYNVRFEALPGVTQFSDKDELPENRKEFSTCREALAYLE